MTPITQLAAEAAGCITEQVIQKPRSCFADNHLGKVGGRIRSTAMADHQQSKGRRRNAAQPLGERSGLVSEKDAEKTARRERRSAGPDGPDARETSPDRPPR